MNIKYNGIDSLRFIAGVGVIDFDNDLDDDLVFTSAEGRLAFYRNDGAFDFVETTAAVGLDMPYHVCAVSSGDLDNDGWQDLVLTTVDGEPLLLFQNREGYFHDVSHESGVTENNLWGTALTLADFNEDGFLDIYLGNYAVGRKVQVIGLPPERNEFYVSQGRPFDYEEAAERLGVAGKGYTLASRFVDFDRDQDMDLYVVNDFGSAGFESNRYYENVNGEFIDRSLALGLDRVMFAMGIGYGDFDNDQDFDFYLSDLGPNKFLANEGGAFRDVAVETFAVGDYTSWGGEFFDADLDGQLDIIMTNGVILGEQPEPVLFYLNLGGQFLDYKYPLVDSPYFARGLAISDFDQDGDADVIVNTVCESDTTPVGQIKVLQNFSERVFPDRHYFQCLLKSSPGEPAVGSTLTLRLDDGSEIMRPVDIGGGFLSVHSKVVQFGIGTRTIERLSVTWPDGTVESHREVRENTLVLLQKGAPPEVLRGELALTAANDLPAGLSIYPSVIDGTQAMLNAPAHQRINVQIYSMGGRLQSIHEVKTGTQPQVINFPPLLGLHIAVISLGTKSFIQKILFR